MVIFEYFLVDCVLDQKEDKGGLICAGDVSVLRALGGGESFWDGGGCG